MMHWKSCLRPSAQFVDEGQGDLNYRGIFGSKSLEDAEWELKFIFDTKNINVQPEPPVKLNYPYENHLTCCVIKPHALRRGLGMI